MNKCDNAKDDPRCDLVKKILLETGVDLPMLMWSEMSEEELKAYYQNLRSREKCGMVASGVAESSNTVASLICNLRSLTGLSQQAFSDKYEIPKRTIEDWERGRRKPPEYVVKLLERVVKGDIKKEG